jgi:hypothetical protein
VELEFETNCFLDDPSFGVIFVSSSGQRILRLITKETYGPMPSVSRGGVVRLKVERLDLVPGTYSLTIGLSNRKEQLALIEDAVQFDIIPWKVYPTGRIPPAGTSIVVSPCSWMWNYE